MPSKAMPAPTHPALGTTIDDDTLELVEVLGIGGYGVVYRAVPVSAPHSQSFAVKCLSHGEHRPTSRKRQIHLREIMLHRLAGAHPNVVTLHKVLEEGSYTYLIMDYAPSHDLFSQILSGRQYLGNDRVIRHVFLQLLDAVEYCHSLGIYHRDLKPENVLCFDDGLRVAITDFGLATTDKISQEFKTGSIYHMSPECQGGGSTGYSPPANDIWSLGIILINLITGRNPFRSSSMDDPTFQCYLQNPAAFLPTVLPLSFEANELLSQMLALDWRDRPVISDIREALDDITSFYSSGVVFEGSMARCPWEAPMEVDSAPPSQEQPCEADSIGINDEVLETNESPFIPDELKSCWSEDSEPCEDESYTSCPGGPVEETSHASWSPTCVSETPSSLQPRCGDRTSSAGSSPSCSRVNSDLAPWPVTPSRVTSFVDTAAVRLHPRCGLTVDTTFAMHRRSCSDSSSMVFTALEELTSDSFLAAFPTGKSSRMSGIEVVERSPIEDADDLEMLSPSAWKSFDQEADVPASPFIYSMSSDSATTLSSFNAACPSSAYTLSSQDSFYLSRPQRDHCHAYDRRSSQPFSISSHSTITDDASPLSSSDESAIFRHSDYSFLSSSGATSTRRQQKKGRSQTCTGPPTSFFRSQPESAKFSLSLCQKVRNMHPHDIVAPSEGQNQLQIVGRQEEGSKVVAQQTAPAGGSLRRMPFRWFSEIRTNIFATT